MGQPEGQSAADSDRATLGGLPTVSQEELALLNTRLEAAGIPLESIVERAGRRFADLLRESLIEELIGRPAAEATVTVLAGTGHKGAAALTVARALAEDGIAVVPVLARKKTEYDGLAKTQLSWLERERHAKKVYAGYNERAFDQADLIVDGLIGAGLEANPRASVSLLIKAANFSLKPVVALDMPTGLDPTTGVRSAVTVKAEATLIVGLPKRGMLGGTNRALCGRLFVVDVGIEPEHWSEVLGAALSDPFHGKPWVEVAAEDAPPAPKRLK